MIDESKRKFLQVLAALAVAPKILIPEAEPIQYLVFENLKLSDFADFNRVRTSLPVVWFDGIKEAMFYEAVDPSTAHKGMTATVARKSYFYYATWGVAMPNPVAQVEKVWMDGIDVTETGIKRVVVPIVEEGKTQMMRFEEVPLIHFGNRIPKTIVEFS